MSRSNVHVALGDRSYDIRIGAGALEEIAAVVARDAPASHVVVVTDSQVAPLHGRRTADMLRQHVDRVDVLETPPGELSKTVQQFEQLCQRLLQLGADRSTLVAAVGGGVIGDLAGYVAASYSRGLRLLQVPTSLLAQVDSSVGGKVGVNLGPAKNMVGAFWQPAAVVIDIDVLKTLPQREYCAGLGEVVKYGVILDADFFSFLEQHVDSILRCDPVVLEQIVTRCCQLKADVVAGDEREEKGLRAALNYGHTFCHAIESVTGYQTYLHGEAVAIGMLCASRLAERLGRIESQTTQRQQRLLQALGLPTECPGLQASQIVDAMRSDKKASGGQPRFVLPSRLGHVELVSGVDLELVSQALAPAIEPVPGV